MEIILIGNEKGGTGKTATTVCLANALKTLGYRVLAVDFDASGNLSCGALPENPRWVLYDVFNGNCTLEEAICSTAVCDILPTIRELDLALDPDDAYILGSKDNKSLSRLGDRLANKPGGEQALRSLLRSKKFDLASKYDFILIDSCPSDNILVTNAIVAADRVLIATEPSADSLDGIFKFISSINAAKRVYVGVSAEIDGIVLTRCSTEYASYRNSILDIQKAAEAREMYLYQTRMRMSGNVPDAMRNCRPIIEYLNTNGSGPVDSLNLALEFLAARGLGPKVDFPGVHQNENGDWVYTRGYSA